jgi:hypothetical protein
MLPFSIPFTGGKININFLSIGPPTGLLKKFFLTTKNTNLPAGRQGRHKVHKGKILYLRSL